ncbi:hemerythrin domain-containing protein [Aldersonia sp. NBC_00410]|uniref:hemerythrin domain-containing protein n=1 Tax=Aldersonia sp. NBC_00410 TaxID=2975954 RepID=UPI00225B7D3F|nr:hemerythrin domain-containing protein [Aldersonia sp. NBC_00410]MCX5045858.1 hemerythrin domain-containing protein [Aldersonia sp. NBC_00410]
MTETEMTRAVATAGEPALHGTGLTDVRMMLVAHTSFRREIGLAPAAVRAVRDGDRRRAGVVADHVLLFTSLLHHHHTIEDEVLWEPLLERVPDRLAPLVHLMESQHEVVASLLDQVPAATNRWRASAAATDGAELADLLTVLSAALVEHLEAEETRLLPIMARHVTAAEWDHFTELGMSSIPKRMTLVGFGMMLYEGDPDVIALESAKLSAPVRVVLPPLARRSFRRYASRIHGTPSPLPRAGF